MTVPAADTLHRRAAIEAQHGFTDGHVLTDIAGLLKAIDALPDQADPFIRGDYQSGYDAAMRRVKALLHPEVQP